MPLAHTDCNGLKRSIPPLTPTRRRGAPFPAWPIPPCTIPLAATVSTAASHRDDVKTKGLSSSHHHRGTNDARSRARGSLVNNLNYCMARTTPSPVSSRLRDNRAAVNPLRRERKTSSSTGDSNLRLLPTRRINPNLKRTKRPTPS